MTNITIWNWLFIFKILKVCLIKLIFGIFLKIKNCLVKKLSAACRKMAINDDDIGNCIKLLFIGILLFPLFCLFEYCFLHTS